MNRRTFFKLAVITPLAVHLPIPEKKYEPTTGTELMYLNENAHKRYLTKKEFAEWTKILDKNRTYLKIKKDKWSKIYLGR